MAYNPPPERMVTLGRAERLARALFPSEVHTGDCKAEIGREGQPCRICAAANMAWTERVRQVQIQTIIAFGLRPTPPHMD